MVHWMMPSEIADCLAVPGEKGPSLLTKQKVGKALRELGLHDNAELCRVVVKSIEASSSGRTYEQRYYNWDEVRSQLEEQLRTMWPKIKLKNGDVELPSYLAERETELQQEAAPPKVQEPSGEKRWSQYQNAIFIEIEEGTGNIVVIARAGSGKTTTIIEAIKYIDRRQKILLCAFSKDIQLEMNERAPSHVEVRTLHSIGFELCRKAFGLGGKGLARTNPIDKFKVANLVTDLFKKEEARFKPLFFSTDRYGRPTGDEQSGRKEAASALRKFVGLCKNTLSSTPEAMASVYYEYNIAESSKRKLMVEAARKVLRANDKQLEVIDYDDMIWFPYRHNLTFGRRQTFDYVLVDEAQDLNAAQLWIAQQLCDDEGRIIALGDDRQAIYGFRGADRHAIPKLIEGLKAKTLPLSVSYRCARNIVGLAQRIVPDIEWAPGAPEGTIGSCDYQQMMRDVRPGDFILSRTNAPLTGACLELLRSNVPAVIAGKDIGQQIGTMVKKSRAGNVKELLDWVDNWLEKEKEEALPERPVYYANCCDKAEVLQILARNSGSIGGLLMTLDRLFSDDATEAKVVCSTVHKAKGMERERVWMIHDTFKPDSEDVEEQNIWYVAVTRAKSELYLCEGMRQVR